MDIVARSCWSRSMSVRRSSARWSPSASLNSLRFFTVCARCHWADSHCSTVDVAVAGEPRPVGLDVLAAERVLERLVGRVGVGLAMPRSDGGRLRVGLHAHARHLLSDLDGLDQDVRTVTGRHLTDHGRSRIPEHHPEITGDNRRISGENGGATDDQRRPRGPPPLTVAARAAFHPDLGDGLGQPSPHGGVARPFEPHHHVVGVAGDRSRATRSRAGASGGPRPSCAACPFRERERRGAHGGLPCSRAWSAKGSRRPLDCGHSAAHVLPGGSSAADIRIDGGSGRME